MSLQAWLAIGIGLVAYLVTVIPLATVARERRERYLRAEDQRNGALDHAGRLREELDRANAREERWRTELGKDRAALTARELAIARREANVIEGEMRVARLSAALEEAADAPEPDAPDPDPEPEPDDTHAAEARRLYEHGLWPAPTPTPPAPSPDGGVGAEPPLALVSAMAAAMTTVATAVGEAVSKAVATALSPTAMNGEIPMHVLEDVAARVMRRPDDSDPSDDVPWLGRDRTEAVALDRDDPSPFGVAGLRPVVPEEFK